MSNTSKKDAPEQPIEDGFPLTIDEFCSQLSKTDKRVALIGGFYASEKASGCVKDTASAFAGRFEAFIKQPA